MKRIKGVSNERYHETAARWLLTASPSDLTKMTEPELAAWQWRHKPGDAAFVMADREFQRRAQRRDLVVGILGVVLGVALSTAATYFLGK